MVPPDFLHLRERLRELKLPVLNIIGKHDKIIPPETAEGVCRVLPRCMPVMINDVGHVPHEKKPAEILPLLRDSVSKVPDANPL